MGTIFKYVEYQLRLTPIDILNKLSTCISNLIASNQTEFPFATVEDLKTYLTSIWKELHRRKFRFCIKELQRAPALNEEAYDHSIPFVIIEIEDDPAFNSNANAASLVQPENVSTSSSSVTLSSYSEVEAPQKRDVDIVEQWLLYMREDGLQRRSAEKAMERFNQFRRQMVEDWLKDFDNYEQELPEEQE